jgi:hypothetical protein
MELVVVGRVIVLMAKSLAKFLDKPASLPNWLWSWTS